MHCLLKPGWLKRENSGLARIAMLIFSNYPQDVRPRREAEALVQEGFLVDIICIREEGQLQRERVKGVNVYRINLKERGSSKIRYLFEYGYFIFAAFLKLTWLHLFKAYDIIHVHNMPEILIVSAIVPKLTGAKLILDLHDPMPELFRTIYSVSEDHPMITVLKWLENFSIKFADLVITPNISFRNLFIYRGCPSAKIHIIMNSPQEDIFKKDLNSNRQKKGQNQRQFALILHGVIEERQGHDIAVRAVSALRHKIPGLMLHIYGSGGFLKHVQSLVHNLNLQDRVIFHGSVSIEEISKALETIDVGIVPNRKNVFTELNFPTRIFECLAMGKPVIAPRTQGILDYFDERSLYLFEPGDLEDLVRKIMEVWSDPSERKRVLQRGKEVYQLYRWETEKQRFIQIVRSL